jgi:hypothetical protein
MASVAEFEVERAREGRAGRRELPERERLAAKVGGGLFLLAAAAALGLASRAIVPRRVGGRRVFGQFVGEAAGELGRGLLAGMFGTLSITVASTVDKLLTEIAHARNEKRAPDLDLGKAIVSPWSFSADVVGKVFGVTPKDAEHERRLSIMAHWEYGSTWGLSLAALRALGVRGVAAIGAVLAGQLCAEMFAMPAFGLFSPPTKWGRRAIVSSVYQHAIYAVAAVAAFEWMQGRDDKPARALSRWQHEHALLSPRR